MRSFYIPFTDPFAVFGIFLLFIAIIFSTILLIFTARRSAQSARKAVHDQARYQRLIQSQLKEERRSWKALEEGRGDEKGKQAIRPPISITAPSDSLSPRPNKTSECRLTYGSAGKNSYKSYEQPASVSNRVTDTASTRTHHERSLRHTMPSERVARPLRVGKQSMWYQNQAAYRKLDGQAPEDECGKDPK
jgi:hypothetical protein